MVLLGFMILIYTYIPQTVHRRKAPRLRSAGIPLNIPSNEAQGLIPINSVSARKEEAAPWYSDQALPFDITLAGTNEQGAATAMKIFGVEILNEGSGISIDDAVTETQATFVAHRARVAVHLGRFRSASNQVPVHPFAAGSIPIPLSDRGRRFRSPPLPLRRRWEPPTGRRIEPTGRWHGRVVLMAGSAEQRLEAA